MSHSPSRPVYWGALFEYLEELLVRGELGCHGDLRYTMEFVQENWNPENSSVKKKNVIDWEKTKAILGDHGGFCDCEVLLNALGPIAPDTTMPTMCVTYRRHGN